MKEKTYCWRHQDVMIVCVARTVREARMLVQVQMVNRGFEVPGEVMTEDPEVIEVGEIAWCFS